MIRVKRIALGGFNDFRSPDDFIQGHVVHGDQPLPQGFGLSEVTSVGLLFDHFEKTFDRPCGIVGRDQSIDFLFHRVAVFHRLASQGLDGGARLCRNDLN